MNNTLRLVQVVGIGLLIIGFALFNILLLWSDYKLSADHVRSRISSADKQEVLLTAAAPILDKTFKSSFEFVRSLRETFTIANINLFAEYAVTQEEISDLAVRSGTKFNIVTIDSLYLGNDPVSLFKRKAWNDYASWLNGKQFETAEALKSELQNTAGKINQFAITTSVGFDRYQISELLFLLTKSSSLSPIGKWPLLSFLSTILLACVGALLFLLPKLKALPGVKNDGVFFHPIKSIKWLGILTGTWLILFYVSLYFFPEYLVNGVLLVDPISKFLNGHEAGRFFLYGFLYTLCILVMGVRMLLHYRHSNYHKVRTLSVMFFQTAFAFLIPEILIRLNKPYFDFKNIWPLDYSFFFDSRINELISNGTLGIMMLAWGIVLIIIGVPAMVFFFGKRWYCSWVCGCGGLAETLGDPFRQLSDKSVKAWKVERWLIHSVLALAIMMTVGVLYTYWTGASWFLFFDTYQLREWYGAFIGAGFAGVVGTGFYPLMGNRVWCRFGCPLAAYLGIIQRLKSRFRITTNGGQCISCGNCSTYCEMGIDVRWYAQRGQNIVRSSCVGCGVCSSVCPRGVLNLEVRDEEGRFGNPILIGNQSISILKDE